ncbi:vWA domain-containing protein [Nocardioides sp. SYSU DS0651]|uniref:vWA domain-containing protein n=1 Tax=Nocardioides sp. SYSU DS0651 TaxID=3415955 RepID=UPI003F4B625D
MSPALASALVIARRVGIALTFVVVLLRPGVGEAEVPTQLSDLEVLVVVDRTRSMAALDHADRQARIQGVQADLTTLAEKLPGARFGMLLFGAETRLVLPFTTDAAAFAAAVETIQLEGPRDGTGSRADRPVPELREVLERAEESAPQRRRVVVYAGDGEDTTQAGQDRSFAQVADLVDEGVVLGYGTTRGAVMPVSDDYDASEGFVRDNDSYDNAVSRADLDNLRSIAEELGVPFEHRTGPGGMGAVAASFDASYADSRDGGRPAEHDLTWLFGLLLLGLVLLELRAGWRAVWTAPHTLAGRDPSGAGR